jgi:hypothetical protein
VHVQSPAWGFAVTAVPDGSRYDTLAGSVMSPPQV